VKASKESVRLVVGAPSQYVIRLAQSAAEIKLAQALRFQVFNLELNEGLAHSYQTGLDEDPFDAVCDHLVVEHQASRQIVGTYRLQTGLSAAQHLGYYCAQEFYFDGYEHSRPLMVELGRACVHRQHRNLLVLGLLWKGIADYTRNHDCRYLIGCSSLTSQEPATGASAYTELCRNHLAAPEWRTDPLPSHECPIDAVTEEKAAIPKLLRAYLTIGAKICGPPALDQQFKTIDFLTLLDLEELTTAARERFIR